MKPWIWLTLAAVVLIGAGLTLVALPSEQEWTTDSPEALAVFEEGVDAMYKLYHEDAYEFFARASELDPDFLMAKLWSVYGMMYVDKEKGEALLEQVFAAETSSLTPRERFFVEYNRAKHEVRRDDLPKIIDEYLEVHPDDPYVLNEKAQRAFSDGEWVEAKHLYERLVEIAPNWVIAYNQLGYINMSEGRFAQAEESFKSYRFIAPDQANPYDSLGELYIAIGRYDEAEQTFEKAIEIKPDFWASYEHIVLLKSVDDDLDGLSEIIDRSRRAGMPDNYVAALECHEQFWGLRVAGSWSEIVALEESSECFKKDDINTPKTSLHLAACELGLWDTAMAVEQEAKDLLASIEEKGARGRGVERLRAATEHLEGVRLALQGEYGEAEKLLRAADERLTYVEANAAVFKLYNRTVIAELLLADGQTAEAHGLLAKVRSVNPEWVANFEEYGHKFIGLDRG
jgi:tetratricopeptide (TPR) repeat protein